MKKQFKGARGCPFHGLEQILGGFTAFNKENRQKRVYLLNINRLTTFFLDGLTNHPILLFSLQLPSRYCLIYSFFLAGFD